MVSCSYISVGFSYLYYMYMNQNPALLKTFHEKTMYMLEWIYEHGGDVYKPNQFDAGLSYQIAECANPNEFERIIEAMRSKQWLTYGGVGKGQTGLIFLQVRLTELGIAEAKKSFPQTPMLSLISQAITTGDVTIDEKINLARELFLREPQTMEHMRSACVALAAVLEPLRDELTPTFTVADVNEFFLIVNRFDIRHNKATTATLEHPEQLEWVFYTLLNTINTYTKLKARLTNL